MDFAYGPPVEPHSLSGGGPQIVDEHIGRGYQNLEGFLGRGFLEIQENASLIAMQIENRATHPLTHKGRVRAKAVAVGALDLDYIGPHVREDSSSKRAHDHGGQIKDSYPR
jgi:hypothetical protein